jgi:hypothetical protein
MDAATQPSEISATDFAHDQKATRGKISANRGRRRLLALCADRLSAYALSAKGPKHCSISLRAAQPWNYFLSRALKS